MTDHGAQTGPEAAAPAIPDAITAERELDRLTAAYPAFRFSREVVGRHGTCWVAQRLDRLGYGVHSVITRDLRELHTALARDSGQPEPGPLTRSAALRALL